MTPPRDAEREAVDFAVLALTRVRHTHMCGCDHQQTDPSCDVTLSVARQIRAAEQRGRCQMREAAAKKFEALAERARENAKEHERRPYSEDACATAAFFRDQAQDYADAAEIVRALPDDTELG